MAENIDARRRHEPTPNTIATARGGAGRSSRTDVGMLVALANVGLVGVPAAYLTSQSVAVTVAAATVAIVLVAIYLRRR